MTFYIDPKAGRSDSAGLTPETARKTYTDLDLQPGDRVLFRRGSLIRDRLYRTAGAAGAPITYGAYGEGENPVFCGSVDVSDPAGWEEVRPNVWEYTGELDTEVCNFIFDNGRMGATLRWEEAFLCAQGDWYDTRIGHNGLPCEGPYRVLLWSRGNPGLVYSHIECALWGKGNLAPNKDWTVTEDLCFWGSGVHGMAFGADNVVIRRCSFCFIGGSVWNRQMRIRYGNAVEFWDHAENVLIENCYFNNVYDSCVTQQGGENCRPAKNLVVRDNLFVDYGMAAYEGRDQMPADSAFVDNICIGAGRGFSAFGDTEPRNSEIYPQPMGHHIFMWRMPRPSEGGGMEIARNKFYGAAGAAVYAIIGNETDGQLHLHDNIYWTPNRALFQQVGGRSFAPAQFREYLAAYPDPGSVMTDAPDLKAEAEEWLARTGCGRNTAALFTDRLPPRRWFIGGTRTPDTDEVRDALSYRVGEDICFKVTLTEEGTPISAPFFSWECRGEDGSRDGGTVSGDGGVFTCHTSLSRPGYVHLRVRVSDEKGCPLPGYEPFEGGACAGFDRIRKEQAPPRDYDEWWARVIREELDGVESVLLEKKDFFCGDPGDEVFDVKIACAGPAPVSGYLRLPKNAREGSLPILAEFMEYGVATAPIPTKTGGIHFCINPHGIENGLAYEEYREMEQKPPCADFGFDREQNADPHTCYFKFMVLRALQALRFCKSLPLWDGKRLAVAGAGMGAFQAVCAAAFDTDVTKAELTAPWLCDLRGESGSGRLGGRRPEPAAGLDYYDTVTAGARVTCPVTLSAGLGDYVCPPSGVTALYHAISGKADMEMDQNRSHICAAPQHDAFTVSK